MTTKSRIDQCLATLNSIEAQLSIMALNTIHEESSIVFHETMMLVGEVREDLQIRRNQIEFKVKQPKG